MAIEGNFRLFVILADRQCCSNEGLLQGAVLLPQFRHTSLAVYFHGKHSAIILFDFVNVRLFYSGVRIEYLFINLATNQRYSQRQN